MCLLPKSEVEELVGGRGIKHPPLFLDGDIHAALVTRKKSVIVEESVGNALVRGAVHQRPWVFHRPAKMTTQDTAWIVAAVIAAIIVIVGLALAARKKQPGASRGGPRAFARRSEVQDAEVKNAGLGDRRKGARRGGEAKQRGTITSERVVA